MNLFESMNVPMPAPAGLPLFDAANARDHYPTQARDHYPARATTYAPDAPLSTLPQPDPEQARLHAYLKAHYKPERFEGRDDDTWGHDYSATVTRSRLDDLNRMGWDLISSHESANGEPISYDWTTVKQWETSQ